MHGNLETISVAELCLQLSGQAMSGTLVLTSPHGTGQLSFQDGNIIWARSPSRSARIGDRLVHSGLLDPYYVDQAAQAQREAPAGTGIAAVLVDRGLVSADAARVFLQEQMLDAVSDMLAWNEGTFELSTEPPPVVRLEISVQTERLLTEVRRRLGEQETIREVVHTLDLAPARTDDTPDTLALDEEAVLRSVDGSKTVEELGSELGFSDNEIRRIVYALALTGAVDLNGQSRPAPEPMEESEVAVADSLDEALTRLAGPDETSPDPAAAESDSPTMAAAKEPEDEPAAPPEQVTTVDEQPESEAPDPETPDPATAGPEAATPPTPEPAAVGADDQRPATIGDPGDVHEAEPQPWVGYANAKTSPAAQAPPPPAPASTASPSVDAAETWDVPSTPLVAGDAAPLADADSGPDEPAASAKRGPVDHRTRSEAASWLAAVSDATEPAEPAPEPAPTEPPRTEPTPPDSEAAQPQSADERAPEPRPSEPEDTGTPEPAEKRPAATNQPNPPSDDKRDDPSAPPPSGDDLSALLAELSSLSTENEGDERPAAPPPRKPSGDQSSGDGKDSKRKRLFGR